MNWYINKYYDSIVVEFILLCKLFSYNCIMGGETLTMDFQIILK